MAPSTPKGSCKEEHVDYQDDGDDDLRTPSSDEVTFPDHASVAVPFRIKVEGASTELEDTSDIHYEVKGDEVKTTTDLKTNRPHNRKVEAGVGISVGTHDSLISHRGFKSEEIDDFRPFHLVKSPADEHSSLASRVPILLAGVENRHRVPDITVKQKRQKKVRVEVPLEIRRWSKRIAGPAKEFNRFFRRLPLELQKAI